jgi:hypothetical protein
MSMYEKAVGLDRFKLKELNDKNRAELLVIEPVYFEVWGKC